MSSIKLLTLLWLVALVGCESVTQQQKEVKEKTPRLFNTKHLITIDELMAIKDQDSVVVIDMRKPDEYAQGHIPGAVNIWRSDVENDTMPYGGMMAPKVKIEALFSRLGIKSTDYLVIYDDKSCCDAARLWWVLDYYGFDHTALLHGGIKNWSAIAEITTKVAQRPETNFKLPDVTFIDRYVGLDEMKTLLNSGTAQLIDCRTPEEYTGAVLKKGAFEKGRIPGSINIDWTMAMDYDKQIFNDPDHIRAIYEAQGFDSTSLIVAYCHTGVRSAHTTFVLTELLGYKNVRNYDGSWTEWSYFKELPRETGEMNKKY